MVREHRKLPAALAGGPKERHRRAQRSRRAGSAPLTDFTAKPPVPKSKHHSYLEFVENKEKKKKLEFQTSDKRTPPPLFEFVPVGNPKLTKACKELSREKSALVYIVSDGASSASNPYAAHINRVGHHFRQRIVEEVRARSTSALNGTISHYENKPEPIPQSQAEYHAQVDAVLRDLFPRVPNTDRQIIIEQAFSRKPNLRHNDVVGFAAHIPLAQRVQLAVLAHVRHSHTRYDHLLSETTRSNARKVVESLCLDYLVKWRGDEETGRDQLDEVLREVVVISDSENDGSDDNEDSDTSVEEIETREKDPESIYDIANFRLPDLRSNVTEPQPGINRIVSSGDPLSNRRHYRPALTRNNDKKRQRGFKRYRAWEEAIQRYRGQGEQTEVSSIHPITQPNFGYVHGEIPLSAGVQYSRQTAAQAGGRASLHYEPSVPAQPIREHRNISPPNRDSGNQDSTFVTRNPYQDLLVRSIEPSTHELPGPSFVRTLPPRQVVQPILPPAFEPSHTPRSLLPATATMPSNVRIVPPVEDFHGHPAGPASHNSRGPLREGFSYFANSTETRQPHGNAEMILVNAARPGEPSHSVLMEDRGGFFEKVPRRGMSIDNATISRDVANHRPFFDPHRRVMWNESSHLVQSRVGGTVASHIQEAPQESYERPFNQYNRIPIMSDNPVRRAPMHIHNDTRPQPQPRRLHPEDVIVID